jgi:hypothetical protein
MIKMQQQSMHSGQMCSPFDLSVDTNFSTNKMTTGKTSHSSVEAPFVSSLAFSDNQHLRQHHHHHHHYHHQEVKMQSLRPSLSRTLDFSVSGPSGGGSVVPAAFSIGQVPSMSSSMSSSMSEYNSTTPSSPSSFSSRSSTFPSRDQIQRSESSSGVSCFDDWLFPLPFSDTGSLGPDSAHNRLFGSNGDNPSSSFGGEFGIDQG